MNVKNTLEFDNKNLVPLLFGEHNSHLLHLEKLLDITISDRGNQLTFDGESSAIQTAQHVLKTLWDRLEHDQKKHIETADIDAVMRFLKTPKAKSGTNGASLSSGAKPAMKKNSDLQIKTKKKSVAPRSPRQGEYLRAIQKNEMVFGVGPAGTGKTYLAVAAGVEMFLKGTVEKLIFCRPAVEAGEHLGFLPGDMKDKVDPYLRPIYDALGDMLPWDYLMKKMEIGEIEIAPLAFMRGRTLSHAFILLDEGQNTTTGQMKMFLTRMGESSRMVITGDLTQTDLPKSIKSGLQDAEETLKGVDEIKFSYFKSEDVVRHKLVGKIINAYDEKKQI